MKPLRVDAVVRRALYVHALDASLTQLCVTDGHPRPPPLVNGLTPMVLRGRRRRAWPKGPVSPAAPARRTACDQEETERPVRPWGPWSPAPDLRPQIRGRRGPARNPPVSSSPAPPCAGTPRGQ